MAKASAVSDVFAFDETPDRVRELSLGCVQYVQRATGVVLDFSSETLPVLDYYLQGLRGEKPAVRALLAPAAGAYFGELVRRIFAARWHAPREEYDRWRVEFSQCFLHFNPVAMAHEAIDGAELVEGGSGFGVNAQDLPLLKAALDTFGAISEDDYFRLATRLEALESIVDRLLASAAQRGESKVALGPDFYRMSLDREETERAD